MPIQKQPKPDNATHNMPEFQRMQYAFAQWIRKPDETQTPQNIERRRMDIYRGLFLNNVKGFLENAFPVAARTLGTEAWQNLVETFFEKHLSTSPYFREIPQEFMAWLLESPEVTQNQPPWLTELLHYEWLELYASTLDAELPELKDETIHPDQPVAISPFFMMAAYHWPVHQISPENQPETQPEVPTLLSVYRTADHKIRFMQLMPQTAMLLELLQQNSKTTPLEASQQAAELSGQPFAEAQLTELLSDLKTRGILLGTPQ